MELPTAKEVAKYIGVSPSAVYKMDRRRVKLMRLGLKKLRDMQLSRKK